MKKIDSLWILLSLFVGWAYTVSGAGYPREISVSQAFYATQTKSGPIELKARDALVHGEKIRFEPKLEKNTIGHWTVADDWVSWDFVAKKPGIYSVELLQACGKGSGGSTYYLNVGNQSLTNTVSETGAYTNFVPSVIGEIILPQEGYYKLSVKPIQKLGAVVMDLRGVTLRPKS